MRRIQWVSTALLLLLAAGYDRAPAEAQIWKRIADAAREVAGNDAAQRAAELLRIAVRCVAGDAACIRDAQADNKPVVLTDAAGTVLTDDKGQPVTPAAATPDAPPVLPPAPSMASVPQGEFRGTSTVPGHAELSGTAVFRASFGNQAPVFWVAFCDDHSDRARWLTIAAGVGKHMQPGEHVFAEESILLMAGGFPTERTGMRVRDATEGSLVLDQVTPELLTGTFVAMSRESTGFVGVEDVTGFSGAFRAVPAPRHMRMPSGGYPLPGSKCSSMIPSQ